MRSRLLVQVILLLAGVGMLVSALFPEQLWLKPFRTFAERESKPIQKFARDLIVASGCPFCAGSAIERKIRFEAPAEMRIDQSVPVRFTYDEVEPTSDDLLWSNPKIDRSEPARRLFSSLNVTLSGANFLVKPQETLSVKPPKKLPVIVVWTIKPETTGAHVIVFDFSALIVNKITSKNKFSIVTTIAGTETLARKQDGIVEVPITVLTEWGVSKRIVDIAKILSAFAGFLLVTPSVWKLFNAIKARALAVR